MEPSPLALYWQQLMRRQMMMGNPMSYLASNTGGAPYGTPRNDGLSYLIKRGIEQQRMNGRPHDPRGVPVDEGNEWIEDPSYRGIQTPFGNFLRRT